MARKNGMIRSTRVRRSANHVAIEVLPVVVRPPVGHQHPYAEELLELTERGETALPLRNRELVRDLIAGFVAASARPADWRMKPIEKHPSPSTNPMTQPS